MSRLRSTLNRSMLTAVASVVALAVTGCGAGNPLDPAPATVGKTAISDTDLQNDIDAELTGATSEEQAASSLRIQGASDGTYRADVVTAKLADRVRYELLGRLIQREGLAVGEEQRTAAKQQLCGTDAQGQPTDCAAFESYPDEYKKFQETLVARELAVVNSRSGSIEEELQAEYDALLEAQDSSLVQSCLDLGVFATEEDAEAAAERAAAGVDLPDLTEQYEAPQCFPFDDREELLEPEYAAIADGTVSDPLAHESGVFLLVRRQDRLQPVEEFFQERGPKDLDTFIDSVLRKEMSGVPVQVDPRYGRWDADEFRVVANDLPAGVESSTDATAQADPAGQ